MFTHTNAAPYEATEMAHFRMPEVWKKYDGLLTWGKGQTLAVLDDGCDMTVPEWQSWLPWGRKVVATWNSIDHNADPTPGPLGYHGTSVGYPSSRNHGGIVGVAYNDFVAHVRSVSTVHLTDDESASMAAALRWVIDHHERYNITSVNFAMLDDQPHQTPMPTAIDAELRTLRQLNIWVSAPCGNNEYTHGISWPACQPDCFGIGAVRPGDVIHRDRWTNTAILVPSIATSGSNAYIAGAAMLLREAIARTNYPWRDDGANLPEAMMAVFKRTGVELFDPTTQLVFRRMDLLAAVDYVVRVWG